MKKFFIQCGLLWLRLISILPMGIIKIIGGFLGIVGYYIAIKRRNIGIKNLSLCFPNMNEKDKHKIIKKHFKYLLTSAMEYGLLFFASRKRIEKIVKIKNPEIINQYYGNVPIILDCPHFVGLELGASRLSIDYVGFSIYSTQKNNYVMELLKNARLRFLKSRGGNVFPRNEGLRPVIKTLRKTNQIFYYLPDQDFGERDSLYVPFFAHPHCATVNVLPRLVNMTNAVVIPMAVYKIGNIYEVELFSAWDNYPSNDDYADVVKINQFVEDAIKPHIEQYFWLHKRFKSQPDMFRGDIYKI